jgi:hypothetical protein
VADQAVLHGDEALAADEDVWVFSLEVGEEVQGEDYGAVGRILEGDHAAVCGAVLDCGEDIFYRNFRGECVGIRVEDVEGRLWIGRDV